MRKLCEVIIFLTSLFHHHPAHAQIATLTGNVNNINTVGQAGGIRVMQVIYELHSLGAGGVDQLGCGSGILPRVTGSGVALATTQWPYTPSGIGAMSGSIYRNDFIDCAGVTPTFYKVYMVYAGSKSLFGSFKIDSTTVVAGNFNFTTATGLTGASFTTAVGSTVGAVLLNPVGDQTITVGSLFINTASAFGYSDASFSHSSLGIVFLGTGAVGNHAGTLVTGTVVTGVSTNTAAMNNSGVGAANNTLIGFSSTTDANAARDLGFSRDSAGVLDCGNGVFQDKSCWIQASKFFANNGAAMIDTATGLTVGSGGGIGTAQFLRSGTATVSNNFGSTPINFQQSIWNGSSASTESWSVNAFESNSGTNPISYVNLVFNNQLNRTNQPAFLLSNAALATSGQNYNSPYLQFIGQIWNGAGSVSDFWTLTPTLGSGTNPTSTLAFSHAGSSGISAIDMSNSQLILKSTTALGPLNEIVLNGRTSGSVSIGVSFTGSFLTLGSTATLDETLGQFQLNTASGTGTFGTTLASVTVPNSTSNTIVTNNSTNATSILGQSSPFMRIGGQYWNGTLSDFDWWSWQNVVGNGTNPTSTLTFSHAGSSGLANIAMPSTSIAGTLNVSGATTLQSSVGVTGTLNVGGQAIVTGGVLLSGQALVSNNSSSSGVGVILGAGCTATSSTNCPSDEEQFQANYWDGSVSRTSTFHWFDWAIGTGSNPTMRLALTHTQSGGTGLATELDLGPTRLASNLVTPASSAAACVTGQTWDDANFVYVCTATNTIKRATLATF